MQICIAENGVPPCLATWAMWHRTRHVALVLCRIQQRLETRLLKEGFSTEGWEGRALGETNNLEGLRRTYLIAGMAETLAITRQQELQGLIAHLRGRTAAEVVVKLEMIVGSIHDFDDESAFPLLQVASALEDLKLFSQHPTFRRDRATTRVDIAHYWESATKLVDGGVSSADELASEERGRDKS